MRIRQDGAAVTVWAPAKLNLFLKILGQRSDGYHEVVTLIVAVDRFDTLTLTPRDSAELTLDGQWATAYAPLARGSGLGAGDSGAGGSGAGISGAEGFDPLPLVEQNLVYKALRLLQTCSGYARGAHVELVKRIPPASGLGGGSSDAAAALLAGNLAWQLGYSRERLMELAGELGSDIPFFVNHWRGDGSTLAVCRGRGEQVTPARAPAGLHFVVARPSSGLSTIDVYRRYKVSRAEASSTANYMQPDADVEKLLAALAIGHEREAAVNFINDLQQPASEISPLISTMSRDFASLDPIVHQMSGSGSAYFGWFRNAAHARHAAGRLKHRGYPHVWHVQTI